VCAAFHSIGTMLAAKITVDIEPAMNGMVSVIADPSVAVPFLTLPTLGIGDGEFIGRNTQPGDHWEMGKFM
jgi:hypothetical protein